jgi:hypothetical protein
LERLHGTFKGGWEDMNHQTIIQKEIEAHRLFVSGSDSEFNECFVNDLSSNASVTLSALEAGYAAIKELSILKGVNTDGQGKAA